ncbi:HEAT repeat domain-containing protein [Sphingomonas jatrophae]|uniref:HEAT repeat-containing protein n=1 Tax=Sphingomonas jatrophae TaxID=1166337 RepID=A0A1I6LAT3_9SPHN|nr:HEAT repeat domain-containing protein [Sphingomonas jatrophae]SFS00338.1 hypothetical protein SAMN05192580_2498 [Sphingomonas jatrophae]
MSFAAEWRTWAPVAAYLRASRAAAGDAAAAEQAVRALLAADGWAERTVAALAAEARRRPDAPLPFPAIAGGLAQGLVLIDDACATISLATIAVDRLAARKQAGGGRGSIGFEGATILYRVLDAGGATLGWWDAPAIDAGFDAGAGPRCTYRGAAPLQTSALLRVDGRREGFIVESASRDILWVQALVKTGREGLRAEYDATTHALVGAAAGEAEASLAQMLMRLLAETGRADAVPTVARWLEDPRFFLRWAAARTLVALDPAAGRAAVTQLADDPHRDVAAAARAALARAAREAQPCR